MKRGWRILKPKKSRGDLFVFFIFIIGLFALSMIFLPEIMPQDSLDHKLYIDLHAVSRANYNVDLRAEPLAPVSIDIIADIILDDNPQANAAARLAAVNAILQTPLPSRNPAIPPQANTPIPATEAVLPESTIPPTLTIPGPSPTATYTVTAGPSPTPTSSPTVGPLGPSPAVDISPTPTATTLVVATATRTNTPVPPTNTSPPPTATHTHAPPSPTTENVCDNIRISNFAVNGQTISWTITNDSATNATINAITINWPSGNDYLDSITLGGETIWDQQDNLPPTVVDASWKGNASRTIGAGSTMTITFQFGEAAASSGYDLNIQFNQDCSKSAQH